MGFVKISTDTRNPLLLILLFLVLCVTEPLQCAIIGKEESMNDFFEQNNFGNQQLQPKLFLRKAREAVPVNVSMESKGKETSTVSNEANPKEESNLNELKRNVQTTVKAEIAKATPSLATDDGTLGRTLTSKADNAINVTSSTIQENQPSLNTVVKSPSDIVASLMSNKSVINLVNVTSEVKSSSNNNILPIQQNAVSDAKDLIKVTVLNQSADNVVSKSDSIKRHSSGSNTAVKDDKLNVHSGEKIEKKVSKIKDSASVEKVKTLNKDTNVTDKLTNNKTENAKDVSLKKSIEVKDKDHIEEREYNQIKKDNYEDKEKNKKITEQKDKLKTRELKEELKKITDDKKTEGKGRGTPENENEEESEVEEDNNELEDYEEGKESEIAEKELLNEIDEYELEPIPVEQHRKDDSEPINSEKIKTKSENNEEKIKSSDHGTDEQKDVKNKLKERNLEKKNKKSEEKDKIKNKNEIKSNTFKTRVKPKTSTETNSNDAESSSEGESNSLATESEENSKDEDESTNKKEVFKQFHKKEKFSESSIKTNYDKQQSNGVKSEVNVNEKEKVAGRSATKESDNKSQNKNHEKQNKLEENVGRINDMKKNETDEIEVRSFPGGRSTGGGNNHPFGKNNDQNMTIPIIFNLHFYNGNNGCSGCSCNGTCGGGCYGNNNCNNSRKNNFEVDVTGPGDDKDTVNETFQVDYKKDTFDRTNIDESYYQPHLTKNEWLLKQYTVPETSIETKQDAYQDANWPPANLEINPPVVNMVLPPSYYNYPYLSTNGHRGYDENNEDKNIFPPSLSYSNPVINYTILKEINFDHPGYEYINNDSFIMSIPNSLPSSISTATSTIMTTSIPPVQNIEFEQNVETKRNLDEKLIKNPCMNPILCEKYPYNVRITYKNIPRISNFEILSKNITNTDDLTFPLEKIEQPIISGMRKSFPSFIPTDSENLLNSTSGHKNANGQDEDSNFLSKNVLIITNCSDDENHNGDRRKFNDDVVPQPLNFDKMIQDIDMKDYETNIDLQKPPINIFIYHITLPPSNSVERHHRRAAIIDGHADSDCFLNYLYKVKKLYNVKDNSNIVVKNYQNDFIPNMNYDYEHQRRQAMFDENIKDPLLLLNNSIYCTDNSVPLVSEYVRKVRRGEEPIELPSSNCDIIYPDDLISYRYN